MPKKKKGHKFEPTYDSPADLAKEEFRRILTPLSRAKAEIKAVEDALKYLPLAKVVIKNINEDFKTLEVRRKLIEDLDVVASVCCNLLKDLWDLDEATFNQIYGDKERLPSNHHFVEYKNEWKTKVGLGENLKLSPKSLRKDGKIALVLIDFIVGELRFYRACLKISGVSNRKSWAKENYTFRPNLFSPTITEELYSEIADLPELDASSSERWAKLAAEVRMCFIRPDGDEIPPEGDNAANFQKIAYTLLFLISKMVEGRNKEYFDNAIKAYDNIIKNLDPDPTEIGAMYQDELESEAAWKIDEIEKSQKDEIILWAFNKYIKQYLDRWLTPAGE